MVILKELVGAFRDRLKMNPWKGRKVRIHEWQGRTNDERSAGRRARSRVERKWVMEVDRTSSVSVDLNGEGAGVDGPGGSRGKFGRVAGRRTLLRTRRSAPRRFLACRVSDDDETRLKQRDFGRMRSDGLRRSLNPEMLGATGFVNDRLLTLQ